jgi:hypothetical protein
MKASSSHSVSASSMSCVVIRIVVPSSSRSWRMRCHTPWRAAGSSPTVGSSRHSTGGRCSIACAISSRLTIPPE